MAKFDITKPNREEFYDMMNRFFTDDFSIDNGSKAMKVDVQEHDDNFVVEADVPGNDKDDIHVEMNNHNLTIKVEHKQEHEEKDEAAKYIRRERSYSSVQRVIHLPKSMDEGITAKLDNGVLTITVPKDTRVNEKAKIEIE
ncbi:Hsp20/alpha crystallin family protein [Culicoidibacter larvae]|uniref:Hsp20/alpha crystallin family protein n=1 Tax=Culicoidibacter larvae TaxID=2579976 RepID=A0A5R8Q9D2_9FIRM|nr:Hsp20/alpha crystallin family protein [Culicoidibacter larvae]TLG72526.1 Hsp20/alpha crystallin family protein [Culicoidibacter larvae]